MNSKKNPWLMIQDNEFEGAIELIDNEFEKTQDYFILYNKVLALFHLRKYPDALLLSEELIEFKKGNSAADFLNLGIAHWMIGNYTEAVEGWLQAQNSMFKDAAGGIEIQVFLYFAAVKRGEDKLKSNTLNTTKKILKSKRSINWPGPLGHYLLGDITDNQLFSYVVNIPILKERQLCQAHFVSAIGKLTAGHIEEYYKKLKDCISYGSPSYLEQMYYMAKGELEAR
jgi:tetratricopeptide (TPR) repeat protein